MNKPAQALLKGLPSLAQLLALSVLLSTSLSAAAQTQSDLLIVLDEDGIGYTAQQTVFADDDLIVITLPENRTTLTTIFSGSGSALYRRAHETEPDKLTLVSGNVLTRFRHRFTGPSEPTAAEDPANTEQAVQLSATIAQFKTTMTNDESLNYRITWVLPSNAEILDYTALPGLQAENSDGWTQQANTLTYAQTGGFPTQMSINYRVHQPQGSSNDACLEAIGPSEWCSPDTDADQVPDYRDLCVVPENSDQPITETQGNESTLLTDGTGISGAGPSRLSADSSLGCSDDALVELPDIQFASGQTYLDAKARVILDKVAIALQRTPDKLFRVATHTDNAGYVSNNQLLSENRADAIRHYLMLRGVGPNQVQARGYGETSPAHDNRTAAGRRANRRVELHQLN